MHSILLMLSALMAVVLAHPVEVTAGAYIALNLINGALPARVITSPFGAVLHQGIDRLSILVRRDAAGTLKLPFVGSALVFVASTLADVVLPPPVPTRVVRIDADLAELERVARAHSQGLDHVVDDATRELTEGLVRGAAEVPAAIAPVDSPAGSRAGERGRAELRALVVLALLSVACSGGALAAAGAAASTANEVVLVVRKVRDAICAERLDPYLGPVRERVVVVHDVALDAGAADAGADGAVE